MIRDSIQTLALIYPSCLRHWEEPRASRFPLQSRKKTAPRSNRRDSSPQECELDGRTKWDKHSVVVRTASSYRTTCTHSYLSTGPLVRLCPLKRILPCLMTWISVLRIRILVLLRRLLFHSGRYVEALSPQLDVPKLLFLLEVYFFQITRIAKRHAYEITLGMPSFSVIWYGRLADPGSSVAGVPLRAGQPCGRDLGWILHPLRRHPCG